jgi:hypothetical protein
MRWLVVLAVVALGCGEPTRTPSAPGAGDGSNGSFGVSGRNSGSGGVAGQGGASGAGGQGGAEAGACDNEADLEVLLAAGSLRSVARTCGLFTCIALIGDSSAYDICVTSCVAEEVEGISGECAACYGSAEACGLDAFCRGLCQSGSCNAGCLACLRSASCEEDFEACRGLSGFECAE